MDEITANSAEAQASVTAAFDSVNLIDAIVGGTSDIETAADKANSADCNYRHLEIMLENLLVLQLFLIIFIQMNLCI